MVARYRFMEVDEHCFGCFIFGSLALSHLRKKRCRERSVREAIVRKK